MIYALLRGGTETLMVLAEDRADDQFGPYQELAPALLKDHPPERVTWFAQHPSGEPVVVVPPEFITALLEGRANDAANLLLDVMKSRGAACATEAV